ncbi:hypothetical protein NQ315_009171 [Exocentrus adspersus]|uniref:Uncharacterized protein n=1 Tax=Exocentrus adspersus TaxID=1586481 RepID=A0AAV8WGK4_9CUCU|nr:hypothetical protein NQ315_009171 [Exocentrus adspersus]
MPLNCMIQLCKITRASKLFQRNFYLPLLKPLSPKDALRRHIITGKNVLSKIEHYIPVLEEYQSRIQRRKYVRRGMGKKRLRKKDNMKYVMPFFDEDMEGHTRLQALLSTKSRGKGQCYTYYVPDKKCTLVLSHQMERAIRDRDIIDVIIAQRNNRKVTLPIVSYDGRAPFYRGEGWTKKEIEESHHHGKDTMSVAKLFEAKESGVEEWELEMMRMAAKRRKKHKGEGTADWKTMMAATAENMDWDKFEEDTKQIVAEAQEPVEDEPIAMAVDDMDKTKDVNEKLKNAGEDILSLLPVIPEIPEIIKIIKDQDEITEIANVSGVTVNLKSNNKERFVPGQMVKSEDGDLFVPGQTLVNENGESEYTPGFTVLLDNEPALIPGLVMGDEPEKPMFLPGESTITESGELQFSATEDDFGRDLAIIEPEVEEVELEEEQNSEEEQEEIRPLPKREKKEFVYERPKRQFTENMGPKHRELFTEKKAKEEVSIDKKRREIRQKIKQFVDSKPPKVVYQPLDPVQKSEKLKEIERNIKKVLKPHDEKAAERRRRGKGVPVVKKRVRRQETERYVEPFFDDNMENHPLLHSIVSRKPKGKGQHYIYEVPDKKCVLVVNSQMEHAIRDKEIIDVIMAQRSEKVVVKLNNGTRVTMPLAPFENNVPLYRGSGWTKEFIEQEHHHGKETMSIAKLFEAKEQGVEDWELEMMRLANKRKKKCKGEDSVDWKQMLQGCLEDMDWNKFEEETKQIVEEKEELVEEEDIPMAVNDMEKTTNVAEKLKQGGEEVLGQLPTMKEIPEVIKILETGDVCELENVSGVKVKMESGRMCFITGQMVKTDEDEVFVPGQTIVNEEGQSEYTPGITIYMDNEPTLIPGLVMGEEESNAMFLPGDSTITEDGQLKFEATEEDVPQRRRRRLPPVVPPRNSRNTHPDENIVLPPQAHPPPPKPRPRAKDEEIVIHRRVIEEPTGRKERVKKRPPVQVSNILEPSPPRDVFRPQRQPMEDPLKLMEEQRQKRDEEEKKRMKDRDREKLLKEESKVDKLRLDMRKKLRDFKIEKPKEYVPVAPVKKSQKLEELEQSIKKGTFFEDEKNKGDSGAGQKCYQITEISACSKPIRKRLQQAILVEGVQLGLS